MFQPSKSVDLPWKKQCFHFFSPSRMLIQQPLSNGFRLVKPGGPLWAEEFMPSLRGPKKPCKASQPWEFLPSHVYVHICTYVPLHRYIYISLSLSYHICIFYIYIYTYYTYTSSTAQGGGGRFKNRKPIGEVVCCESRMAERSHWWTDRWLRSPLFLSFFLSCFLSFSDYLSI